MIKDYSATKPMRNFKYLICLFFMLFLFIHTANSQCSSPPVGCPNTDLSNFGVDSDNNATTIEYDNFISSFHTTIVRTSDGSLQTWGENVANDGVANVLAPLTINVTNFPALGTAIPLKAGLGSNSANNVQGIILATDGLYAWSKEGIVLDASITSSTTFQKIAIQGNANGLPTGVNPGDVKMIFATYQTLAITTCSGDVWVISQNANTRGNGGVGDALTWYKVTTATAGNPFLDNVVACRGNVNGLMALKSDGTVYVWGENVLLGNNSAIIPIQNRATQMTLPSGVIPKMIGSTGSVTSRSYYILSTDENLYALGKNSSRQLGDWTTTDRLSWVQPRYTSAAGPVMNNVKWFSSQEHDRQYASVNIINSAKNLYAFGDNNNSLLGTVADPANPVMPNGISITDNILAVETGGHTSMIVRKCDLKFGYAGHRIRGSMGDGTNASTTEASYNFATAAVQICGVESLPVIQPVTTGGGPNSNYCTGSSVLLEPSPAGGTLTVLSGPGNLVANTLNFTGVGVVKVQYSVATDCGGTSVTTKDFQTESCNADLKIIKVSSNATPNVGSNVTFTITASNAGPSDATGVSVSDVLPAGYTFVSATPSTGTWSAPNWTIGNLANGGSATLAIVATVNATGSYSNTATITGTEPDPTPGDNTSTTVPTPKPQSNLAVVKTVNNATPNVGSNVTFTITASNAGPSDATGVSVSDVLPAGYTFVSATPSTGTWSAPNWTIGNLANGGSATLAIVATVNATGSYSNTATITGTEPDPTPGDNTSTTVPTPKPQSNLAVVKTVNNATPNVGSNVTFTITASNAGPSDATGVSVSDVLPAGYTFVSATPSTGTWSAPNWTIGNLANGGSATLAIVATVNATGSYSNTATITGTEPDPTPGDNTSTTVPTPKPQSNLAVVKTVNNATPNVGSNVTFTITASNAGPSDATGVSVSDVLPAGYTFVSATPSTGTWSAPNWTIGNLANGGSATLAIVATVNATGSYSNTATITGTEPDPTPGDNTSTTVPTPKPQSNLAVVKTVNNATPNVGSNVTFTITASNAGPSDATGVSVSDVLPAGYTFVSATPSTGTWSAPNWTIGNLTNGGSVTLAIVATVNATGSYSNTATITGTEPDPTPGDNTSTTVPTPKPQSNLAVVKTVNNATPNVGSNVTFTITASNAGPSDATGVSVSDVLPAGYTFVSATPSTGTWSAPNWTIGNLANGGSATLAIVATVNATGSYSNTATITGTEPDPTPGDNTSTTVPTPKPQSNLAVVKTVNNATPNVGSNVTFTITASNAGPSDATGVSVSDVLPAGYTFVSATPSTGTWSAPNWTIGNLANGGSVTLAIVATVNATGSYSNTATITGTEPDPTPGDNTSTTVPTPKPQSNLAVVKTVNNATPNVGSNVTFTITASNAGPSDATGVSVSDVLPAGYTFVSATPSTGTWSAPNWTIGNLANGGSATLAIVATVNATGSYSNTATITGTEPDPTPGDNTSTTVPTPKPQSNLAVVKTVNNATPNVGSNVTFTITASNAGPSDATGVSVSDVLPAGYTFVSATPSTGTWSAPNWTIGNLANGGSATLAIVATVNATGSYSNTATITGTEPDPTPGDNTSTTVPTPKPQSNLAVVKTVNNATPNVGSNVTFTITASNAGPSDATGVSVSDVLPAGYTFVSATPSTGTWSAPNWTIGNLANGGSATLAIVATVNATGSYSNTATITGTEPDPTPGDNTSTTVPTPKPQSNLAVVKTVNNATPNVGSNVTFTITASNAGPSDATGVSVSDVLPAGYTFVSATPSTGTWSAPNWTIGNLANGGSATLAIVATVNATGSYSNTATITGTEPDPTPGDNTSTTVPTPKPQSNLAVVKTVNNATPNVGSNVTFTITASNAGPSDATGVSVSDVLPAGYTFVSATPSTGTWSAPNWTIGNLANGGSVTLAIVATVNATGSYSNTATITGTEPDPTPGDNTSTTVPTPKPQSNLAVVKTVNNATPNVGSNVTFTITASNAGPSDATGVSVSDVLPAGYTFVSATPSTGTWSAPNWTIGNLANGGSATLAIVATVNATGSYSNTATITGTEPDPTPGDNTSTTVPTPKPQSNLAVVKTVNNATPNVGSNVTFTITASNAGPSDATGVSVSDVLPAGYTFVSATPSTGTWSAPNWTIGNLANGGSATLVIVATVNATGSYSNTAIITGTEADPILGDNISTIVPKPISIINAVTETEGPINGSAGGTTRSLIDNDTLDGRTVVIGVNSGHVVLTLVSIPAGLTLNPDGTVTVGLNTPAGFYDVQYTICEVSNPGNCATITSVVHVVGAHVDANDDSATIISGSTGTTGIINIFENDTLNGSPTGLSEVTLTVDTPDATGHIVLNADGKVDLAPGTPAGTYQITYTICEKLNPVNCSTAVVTVIVNTIEDIDIYTHVTPNGDGDNDVFYIDGITKFPNNTVEIYNRWGVLVYQAKGYDNETVAFNGKSSGRTTVNANDNLPEGTYYYIVRYVKTDGNTKEKAGYLYLNR
ncbi:DUF11 domain-containing protein [Flavobacterium sp. F-65]|uniref:DUF11 domain-containing protein n=1 Tax=Flavobacterium pisciphilum TaxID=2893755 RepID=A0ABS8MS50_9FLAO|nr:gliding motility-associated C-terminal domain-containing protein [Flavobacterium sp. F-65]MCC9071586.1 DUF11 domain-containing protein [Flavobacterium sp. F-65]